VGAKYPISVVVLKRKNTDGSSGGTIIWQINEHNSGDGVPESAHLQLTGIFIVKDPRGEVVRHFVDRFRELQRRQRSLTLEDLRCRGGERPAA
jgi:hypothetical protein